MDAVGIEPTTFHMCEDAKRLETLLVECSDKTGFERRSLQIIPPGELLVEARGN